jgi:putative FmdB family regulatory protein
MPLYDYKCPACGAETREWASMSAIPATVPCPACGTEATRPLTAPLGYKLLGDGFHKPSSGRTE